MTIRSVLYSEILDAPNAAELLAEYTAECSLPELGQTHPQPQLYQRMEESGGLQVFGVYDGKELIGFAAVLVYVLPHYGKKVATTESIFIAESHRHTGIGEELIAYIEAYARSTGCFVFLYSAPVGSRFDRLLALHYGKYRHTNNVYLRQL